MMRACFRTLVCVFLLIAPAWADHVIVTGGPALRKWEDLRVPQDRHDRWWANFVRASTLRMAEVRQAYGSNAPLVWMVYRPGYQARGREDGKPYTQWITEQAAKRRATLIWFDGGQDFIRKLNSRPRGSIQTFDFFGHSNKHAFMFDYGSDIMAASIACLHERDLPRIKGSVFQRSAYCKSWGCHTGESMSGHWKGATGVPLEGAKGPTDYTVVGQGQLPRVKGSWAR
ncbi:MAG: hypothetical protein H7A49_13030 [Akkermansiaceae bacterium]|nr:hypothetical protein [Akkermansiaceae bacterium]